MSSSNNESGHNDNLTRNHDLVFTAPELFLLVLLLLMSLLGLLLCLESTDCVQKLLEERKRMRKALQYKPSEELSRISPEQGGVVITPVKDLEQEIDNNLTKDEMKNQVENLKKVEMTTDLEIESL